MSFQTELTPMDIQVFESVLYNAEKEIPKIKLTLQFDDEQKYKRFINRFNPVINEDEDVLSNSDSEDASAQGQQPNDELGMSHQVSVPQQIVYVQKLSRLEMSIILKENYKDKIQNIIKKTDVRILIVPQKLKFFGFSEQSIQQAKSQIHQIRLNIIISSLQKFGKQVYQSQFLKQKLAKCGIKLGRVAQKYYYWYDESQSNQIHINQTLSQIFNKSTHIFYPLLQNHESLRRRYNEKYINAIIKANAQLYTKYLDHQINEQKNYRNAQLNETKTQIIIHVAIKQQAQKIKFQIKKFYSELIHFFIHFKTQQENGQIKNIKEIQNKLSQINLYWSRYEDLLVITFSLKNVEKPNQTVLNVSSLLENKSREFVDSLRPALQLNSDCYIEYLRDGDAEQVEEIQDKNQALFKKITIQYKPQDGIFVIAPKIQTVNTYLNIIDQLVLRPKLFNHKLKKKAIQTSSLNVQLQQINQTSIIQDTTTMIQTSNIQGNPNQVSHMVVQNGELLNNSNILEELKQNQALMGYTFCFGDKQGSKKYQEIDEIKRGKAMRCEDIQKYQEQLYNITKRKYQIFDVCLPLRIKPTLNKNDDLVTVFAKDSQKQNFTQPTMNVYLLADSKILSNNGWLINVNKSNIKDNNYKYEIPTDKMQIVNFVKFIED